MKTLILAGETPVPARSGMRLRILGLARQLAAEAEVVLAALGRVPADPGEPFSLVGVPYPARLRARLRSLWVPREVAHLGSSAMGAFARGDTWSTIQAHAVYTVGATRRASAPVVFDCPEVWTDACLSMARLASSPVERARWRWEAAKARPYERAAIARADAVSAVSDEDAARVDAWGARRTVLVPNGVDTARTPHGLPAAGAALLFVGAFVWRPNVEAARELIDEVFPRVRRSVPEARLEVVGRAPGQALEGRSGDGVEVTGEAPDLLPHLRRSRALVLPLRAGGGTRIKVLTALAAGVPVVSTRFGVAGLGLVDGEHVLLAEKPSDLAEQTVRVIRDDALAAHLSREGRALVERRFDWSTVARPLIDLHLELAERARRE